MKEHSQVLAQLQISCLEDHVSFEIDIYRDERTSEEASCDQILLEMLNVTCKCIY